MTPSPSPFLVLASLRAALDQPVFPGKAVVWLLFMLSIVGWVMILSAALRLRRARLADLRFTERLRQSKTTLEVFEEGWEDAQSPKHLIYQTGARETAYQLLGSREPQEAMRLRLRQAGKLSGRQVEFLRLSFRSGYRAAVARLQGGIEGLRLVSSGGLLLGGFGFVWTLMAAFDQGGEFAEMAPRIGGALGFLALGLLVAGPGWLARLALRIAVGKRKEELARYRDDLRRLFERSFVAVDELAAKPAAEVSRPSSPRGGFGAPEEEPEAPSFEPEVPAAAGSPGEPDKEAGSERRRYRSIRDRLLRSEEDEEAANPFRVNPIARQAAAAGGLRGY